MENPYSSVRDGVGFPSLEINERLIPAHLTMLDAKRMLLFSSELGMAWVFLGISLGKSLGKPMPSLAQIRRVLHAIHLGCYPNVRVSEGPTGITGAKPVLIR